MPLSERVVVAAVVAAHYPLARWVCLPNADWGMGLGYEADCLCISKSDTRHEVEAKISAADLKADVGKRKWRLAEQLGFEVDYFWYAVPKKLAAQAVALAEPKGFGVYVVTYDHDVMTPGKGRWVAEVALTPRRLPRRVHGDRRKDRTKAWRLLAFRYWSDRFKELKNAAE